MDESQNPILPDELDGSERSSTVADRLSAGFARSGERAALSQQHHSDQINLCRDDLCSEASVVVYCGSEEEVAHGFLYALLAMGVAAVEQPPEPATPPLGRAKP